MRIFLGTTERTFNGQTYHNNMYMTNAVVKGQTEDGMYEQYLWSCEEVSSVDGSVILYSQDSEKEGTPIGMVETATRIVPAVREKVSEIIVVSPNSEV